MLMQMLYILCILLLRFNNKTSLKSKHMFHFYFRNKNVLSNLFYILKCKFSVSFSIKINDSINTNHIEKSQS